TQRPAHDRELLVREDHVRPLPLPHRAQREQSRNTDERRAGDGERPAEREEKAAGSGEREGASERGQQDDTVPAGVEIHALMRFATHVRAFRRHRRGSFEVSAACDAGDKHLVQATARKAAVATLVVLGMVVLAIALWKLRVLLSLFFLGLVIAAAMRPGIEWLHERRVPRSLGLAVHYLAIAGVVALLLWLVVPRAATQVSQAIGTVPTSSSGLDRATKHSTGIKHEILRGIQKRLKKLPT